MRPLKPGEKVKFNAFSGLSGDYETEGYIEGEAKSWPEANKNNPEIDSEEYAELEEGDAYIIQTEDIYHNIQRHLVYVGDMISVFPAEKDN